MPVGFYTGIASVTNRSPGLLMIDGCYLDTSLSKWYIIFVQNTKGDS